jgi:soluble lytic murein transglycosylase-like protein
MSTDQHPRRPRGSRAPLALRDFGLAAVAIATLAGATWGTARLPNPRPFAPANGPATGPAPVAPGAAAPAALAAASAPAAEPTRPGAPVVVPALIVVPAPGTVPATAMVPGFTLAPAIVAAPAPPSLRLPAPLSLLAPPKPIVAVSAAASARLTAAERRARREEKARADSVARVAPVEHVLRRYSSNRTLTRRIAAAVSRESRRAKLEPSLVVAVLVAENNVLKPHARNRHTSARGLMQVMPGWAGRLGCSSSDLTDVDANICHGVRVLSLHLKEARGDLHHGLQRFNGCRRTPDSTRCDVYPTKVLAHAERLEGQMETYAQRQKAREERR